MFNNIYKNALSLVSHKKSINNCRYIPKLQACKSHAGCSLGFFKYTVLILALVYFKVPWFLLLADINSGQRNIQYKCLDVCACNILIAIKTFPVCLVACDNTTYSLFRFPTNNSALIKKTVTNKIINSFAIPNFAAVNDGNG